MSNLQNGCDVTNGDGKMNWTGKADNSSKEFISRPLAELLHCFQLTNLISPEGNNENFSVFSWEALV